MSILWIALTNIDINGVCISLIVDNSCLPMRIACCFLKSFSHYISTNNNWTMMIIKGRIINKSKKKKETILLTFYDDMKEIVSDGNIFPLFFFFIGLCSKFETNGTAGNGC
jgi:hypothetical protein